MIVATPDLASLRNGKAMFDLIKQQRPNDPPPRLVLNQVGQPKRPEIPVKDFAATMAVEPTLVLPYDPQLYGSAANNAQMLMQMKATSPTARGHHAARGTPDRPSCGACRTVGQCFRSCRSSKVVSRPDHVR